MWETLDYTQKELPARIFLSYRTLRAFNMLKSIVFLHDRDAAGSIFYTHLTLHEPGQCLIHWTCFLWSEPPFVSLAHFCKYRNSSASPLVIRWKRVSHVRAAMRKPLPRFWSFLFCFFPVGEVIGGKKYQRISNSEVKIFKKYRV